MIRTIWVIVLGTISTAFHAAGALLPSLWSSPRAAEGCRRHNREWAKSILRAAGVHVELEGLENIDRDAPQVMVANHESWFDVWALSAHIPIDLRFVAKKELGSIPLFGSAWKICGHVSVDRSNRASAIESMNRATRRIAEESMTIVMFPEGTRAPDRNLLPFKKGAFVISVQSGVPIVPVAVIGGRTVMSKGSWRVRSAPMTIRVGRPIPTTGLAFEDRNRLLEAGREAIEALRAGAPVDSVGGPLPPGAPAARGGDGS